MGVNRLVTKDAETLQQTSPVGAVGVHEGGSAVPQAKSETHHDLHTHHAKQKIFKTRKSDFGGFTGTPASAVSDQAGWVAVLREGVLLSR
jgi:hypothetical protein